MCNVLVYPFSSFKEKIRIIKELKNNGVYKYTSLDNSIFVIEHVQDEKSVSRLLREDREKWKKKNWLE